MAELISKTTRLQLTNGSPIEVMGDLAEVLFAIQRATGWASLSRAPDGTPILVNTSHVLYVESVTRNIPALR
jgi:hypothetical protein